MFIVIVTIFLLVIHQGQCSMNATAIMHPPDSQIDVGTIIFTQENTGSPVLISISITGLNASSAHGFHIHASPVSEGSPNCSAAGPHFNPYNTTHGPREANITSRHVGDLGNLTTDDSGNVEYNMEDYIIQLYNATQSIVGRSAVVHLLRDDGGQGGFVDSNTTGNAGFRMMCGLVKLTWQDPTTTTIVSSTTTPGSSTETTTGSSTTTPVSSTSTAESSTSPSVSSTSDVHPTTPSAGLKIKSVMFILIITMIINYIIRY